MIHRCAYKPCSVTLNGRCATNQTNVIPARLCHRRDSCGPVIHVWTRGPSCSPATPIVRSNMRPSVRPLQPASDLTTAGGLPCSLSPLSMIALVVPHRPAPSLLELPPHPCPRSTPPVPPPSDSSTTTTALAAPARDADTPSSKIGVPYAPSAPSTTPPRSSRHHAPVRDQRR
jgi:hypothetical protein